MADAVTGKGCDRHLFGLKLIHQTEIGGNLPEIYLDKGFSEGVHHRCEEIYILQKNISQKNYFLISFFFCRLSTSNVPGTSIFGGFGNVVDDGYGCCYIIKPKRLDISVVSSKRCMYCLEILSQKMSQKKIWYC